MEEAVLRIGLTCRNTSGEPMPCGLGQHPYFPCSAGTRIETSVTHVWTIDEEVLRSRRCWRAAATTSAIG